MGSIPNETIEQIAAANDIVEVIGSYFPLNRAGTSYKALCPFHQEKSPSFTVSSQRQTFHCFGCGVGGSVFRFLMDYEHVDFPTAVKKLGARAGITVVEDRRPGGQDDDRGREIRSTLLEMHAEAAAWFHENLLKSPAAGAAREYLKRRGIDRQVAGNWQIGFALESWDATLRWALDRGYRRGEILQSGLVKPRDENRPDGDVYDRFRSRVMFPICNDIGEVIAFSGRVIEQGSEAAKYLNSPETPLFRKGNVLFGLHKTKRALIDANSAVVCEGQLDLIGLFEAGIKNVVAPQGTAFTEQQARKLKQFVGEVVLCFDADAAGHKAAERSMESLLKFDLVVRVATMPAGEDPDSLIRSEGKEAFSKRLADARDFFESWIDHEAENVDLHSLAAKLQLARNLGGTVSRVSDPLMRGEIARKVSARLGVPLGDFEQLLTAPGRDRSGLDDQEVARERRPLRHEIAMLSLLALRDDEARASLLRQPWRDVLSQTPDAEVLVTVLAADLRPDDPASVNAWMATLSPVDEATIAGLMLQKLPANAAAVAQDWWMGLRQAMVRRQLQIAEGRMKIPHLTTGEVVALQKQILDLGEQLRDFSQLSSNRSSD